MGGGVSEVFTETQSVNTTYTNSFNLGFTPKLVCAAYMDSSTNKHFRFLEGKYDESENKFSGFVCYATASYQESYNVADLSTNMNFSNGVLTLTTTSATGFNGKTLTIMAI